MSLSNPLQQAMTTRRIEGEYPLDRLRPFLEALAGHDRVVERRRGWGGWLMVLTLPLAILILIFSNAFPGGTDLPLLMVAGLFGAGLFLYLHHHRQDLENSLRAYLLPLLDTLAPDLDPRGNIALNMRLDPIESAANLVATSQPVARGVYSHCVESLYRRPFLALTLPFHDGNRLEITGQETLRKLSRTRRNSRGRSKTKFKYRKRFDFSLRLKVDDRLCLAGADPGVKVKQNGPREVVAWKHVQVTGKEGVPSFRETLRELARVFGRLQPVG